MSVRRSGRFRTTSERETADRRSADPGRARPKRRMWRARHAPPPIALGRPQGVAVRTSRRLSSPPHRTGVSHMLIDRRAFLASLAAVGATASGRAFAQRRAPVEPVIPDEAYYDGVAEDGGFQFRRTNMKRIAPRFRRQLVKYIHKEPPGSPRRRYEEPRPLRHLREQHGAALRRRRREGGLPVVRARRSRPQGGVARLDAARGNAGAPPRPAPPHERRAGQPARARAPTISIATARISSIASTAPPNLGRSAPTSPPAASAC